MKRALLLFAAVCCIASMSFSQTWVTQTSGTTNTIREVFFVNATNGWAVGENGTILKTTDGGAHWQNKSTPSEGLFIGCYFFDGTTGYVGGDHGMRKTTDGGNTWSFVIGSNAVYPDGITKMFFLDANHGWAVGGADGSSVYGDTYATADGGVTWTRKVSSDWVRFYGVQFVDTSTGWVYSEKKGLVLKSTDAGKSWTIQITTNDTLKIQGFYFLDKNTGWVAGRTNTAGAVLKTTDGGATWKVANNTVAYSMYTPHFTDANNGSAFGVDRNGHPAILKTTDGGATWTPHAGPGTVVPEGVNLTNPTTGWVYGDYGTIIKIDLTTDVHDRGTTSPNQFALGQNYPNPFNPTTNISFSLPAASFTSLKVFDVLGNESVTLVNQQMTAGNHTVTFNASHLTSGVYFYRLQSGAFSETKKLILAK